MNVLVRKIKEGEVAVLHGWDEVRKKPFCGRPIGWETQLDLLGEGRKVAPIGGEIWKIDDLDLCQTKWRLCKQCARQAPWLSGRVIMKKAMVV